MITNRKSVRVTGSQVSTWRWWERRSRGSRRWRWISAHGKSPRSSTAHCASSTRAFASSRLSSTPPASSTERRIPSTPCCPTRRSNTRGWGATGTRWCPTETWKRLLRRGAPPDRARICSWRCRCSLIGPSACCSGMRIAYTAIFACSISPQISEYWTRLRPGMLPRPCCSYYRNSNKQWLLSLYQSW